MLIFFPRRKFHDAVYVILELDGVIMWPQVVGVPAMSALMPSLLDWESVFFMESYTLCTPEEAQVWKPRVKIELTSQSVNIAFVLRQNFYLVSIPILSQTKQL